MLTLYKHVNNTDVAVEVTKRFYVREKRLFKMKVKWWNIGQCHDPWCMGESLEQKIEVDIDAWLRDWKPYASKLDFTSGWRYL